MRTPRHFLIPLFFSAILFTRVAAQQATQVKATPKVVTYCEIALHRKDYDGSISQTEGIFIWGQENRMFYSPLCPAKETISWVDYSDDLRRSTSPELMGKMEELLNSSGRVKLTVILEFDGPKKVDVPPDTPPKVADLMRSVNSRYGHLNQFSTRVLFLKILAVDPVPQNVPTEGALHESGGTDLPSPK